LPASKLSSSASRSVCSRISADILVMMRARSAPDMRDHGPFSKALRAARTARSMSCGPASATCVMVRSVTGSRVASMAPLAASLHLPSISRPVGGRSSCAGEILGEIFDEAL
jgi:hypothetical protein